MQCNSVYWGTLSFLAPPPDLSSSPSRTLPEHKDLCHFSAWNCGPPGSWGGTDSSHTFTAKLTSSCMASAVAVTLRPTITPLSSSEHSLLSGVPCFFAYCPSFQHTVGSPGLPCSLQRCARARHGAGAQHWAGTQHGEGAQHGAGAQQCLLMDCKNDYCTTSVPLTSTYSALTRHFLNLGKSETVKGWFKDPLAHDAFHVLMGVGPQLLEGLTC